MPHDLTLPGFKRLVREAYRDDRLERARWLRSLPWRCRQVAYECERRLAETMREALDAGSCELDLAVMGPGVVPLATPGPWR